MHWLVSFWGARVVWSGFFWWEVCYVLGFFWGWGSGECYALVCYFWWWGLEGVGGEACYGGLCWRCVFSCVFFWVLCHVFCFSLLSWSCVVLFILVCGAITCERNTKRARQNAQDKTRYRKRATEMRNTKNMQNET